MDQTDGRHRTPGYDAVHARLLLHFPELAGELGGDAAQILRASGTSLRDPAACAQPVSYGDCAGLLETAARELACPDFGMRLAVRQNGAGLFGPLGQVMRNSRRFGDALAYVAEHSYAHSLAARVWLERDPAGQRVFAGHDILLDGAGSRQQAIEHVLLAGHLSAMALTGGRARARRVHFRHEPVSGARAYARYFGCTVRFGQEADGIAFADGDLAAPIEAPDEETLRALKRFIDRRFTRRRPPFDAQVRALLLRQLATGQCSAEQVARSLCLHVRTLHRRLHEAGTGFRALKDEVRRDLLDYYLKRTDLDMARISERLGFAEQSVMSRYCRRTLGASPTQLRREAG